MTGQDQPLVTDRMVGFMVVLGADIVLFVGVLAAVGAFSVAGAAFVTLAVAAFFIVWIAGRWWRLRGEGGDGGDMSKEDPVEALKRRYAAGELSEAEFERRLDELVEADRRTKGDAEAERALERARS